MKKKIAFCAYFGIWLYLFVSLMMPTWLTAANALDHLKCMDVTKEEVVLSLIFSGVGIAFLCTWVTAPLIPKINAWLKIR